MQHVVVCALVAPTDDLLTLFAGNPIVMVAPRTSRVSGR